MPQAIRDPKTNRFAKKTAAAAPALKSQISDLKSTAAPAAPSPAPAMTAAPPAAPKETCKWWLPLLQ